MLALVDGARTAADISHVLGRPAFHTLVDLRRLAAAGLVRAAAPRPLPPPATPAWAGAASTDPDVALLRRLRDALEAL